MLTRIYWVAFIFISVLFVVNLQTPLASTTAHVDYDGKSLSVHADGAALGQVLSLIEEQTDVRFSYDTISAETIVYANFENNTLADGIKRILSQFNHAMVYNGSGHIRKVLVLNRQMASLQRHRNQGEVNVSQPMDEAPLAEAPENDLSDNDVSAEMHNNEAKAFSVQIPGQGPDGNSPPPGGEPSLPSQAPPGAENQSQLPPPLLDQDAENMALSNTEEQGFFQPDDIDRIPDDDLSEPPDVYEKGPGLVS